MANQIGGVNQSKNGSRAILNFGASRPGNSFIYPCDHDENGDEFLDEFLNQPEKKRRLSMDQVQFLEKCFTADNKLEPDRKIQIAKELGLQPRQITIWFQNRRARWKTRQLETDYEALHRNYERLKTEYDALFSDHQKLKAEALYLRTNSEPDLQAQGYEENSRRVIIADEDHDPRGKISRIESKISVMSDVLYEEDSLLAGGLSYTLDPDYPNSIVNLDDELLQSGYVFSKVEVSRYLPDGSGFYLEFPNEDPAPGSWSD